MEFFNSAVDVLKTLVVALGAGLGVWGAVNLMEGYGGDNPSAKSQGMKQFICSLGQAPIRTHPFSSGRQSSTSSSRKSVLDGIMILRSSSMFRWKSLKNSRVIRSRCVLRVGVKRTLNKHPLGGWVFRMGESSFLTKLLVKL